jgi:hypothetical protein
LNHLRNCSPKPGRIFVAFWHCFSAAVRAFSARADLCFSTARLLSPPERPVSRLSFLFGLFCVVRCPPQRRFSIGKPTLKLGSSWNGFHIASMLHGAADTQSQPLNCLEKICNMMQHEIAVGERSSDP